VGILVFDGVEIIDFTFGGDRPSAPGRGEAPWA
jgi:hypothetical protein